MDYYQEALRYHKEPRPRPRILRQVRLRAPRFKRCDIYHEEHEGYEEQIKK